jgi:predicted CXXCH cytochrome family protein
MHYSQNGTLLSPWGSSGPYSWLNTNSCLGCHTSTTGNTIVEIGGSRIPIVFNTGGYPVEPLAGGNFYKASLGGSGNDIYGHNVEGISGADNNLVYVPGKQIGGDDTLSITDCYNCHKFMAGIPGYPFTKSRSGNVLICEDCHTPKHHADDSSTVVDSTGGWYRFVYEVKGIEDTDWEQTVSPTDHNEYQGETTALGGSISDYGCGCHGDFHALRNPSEVGSGSPWLKHPADVALPTLGEYSVYTTYNPQAPVARPDLSGYSGPSEVVTPGIDQVMCLSCHRSHGSDQPDMLRWNYSTMVAGGGGSGGCFTCHTQKNQTP